MTKKEDARVNVYGLPYDFTNYGRDPMVWGYQADNLKRAAEAVYAIVERDYAADPPVVEHLRSDPVYKYLVGMAIENLLKGIMIYDNPSLVTQNKIDNAIDGHDMWTLHTGKGCKKKDGRCRLEALESELIPDEQEFVKLLEPYVVWMGRYGIATTRSKYESNLEAHTHGGEDTKKQKLKIEEFDKMFHTVYEKISSVFANKLIV